jgi:hypothetical protein
MKINTLDVIAICALHCVYFVIYLVIYNFYLTGTYGYMGYEDELNLFKIPFAIFAVILCGVLAGTSPAPSVFFLHLALGVILVPSMVLYCGANLPIPFYLVSVLAYMVVAFTSKTINLKSLRLFEINNSKLLKSLVAISIGTVVGIFLLGGARFLNFDFATIYEVRGDAARNLPAIFAYLNSVVGKVVIPFGVVVAVLQRRWLYVGALSLTAILLFGLTAHKSILFTPVVVLFVYYITGKKTALQYFVLALIISGVISAAEFNFSNASGGDYLFSSLFIRRALLTPSLINYFYLDWFSNNDYYFWADSKLSFGLVDPPSALRSMNLIGLEYFGREENSANAGWIGSGYANAGLAGVIIYSLGVGLLLSLLDSYAKKLGARLVISLFVASLITILTSTDLITSLFTHGVVLAIVLISIMRPVKSNK